MSTGLFNIPGMEVPEVEVPPMELIQVPGFVVGS
jgi:hypothetical protein